MLTIARRTGEDSFVVWLVVGGFGLVGALLLLTGSHRTFALRSRETILEPLETVTWKFEVWGKVRGRADFMHPFEVKIV